jgi:hypothetical protein
MFGEMPVAVICKSMLTVQRYSYSDVKFKLRMHLVWVRAKVYSQFFYPGIFQKLSVLKYSQSAYSFELNANKYVN